MLMLDKMRRGDEPQRSEYGSTQNRRMIGYDRDYEHEHTRTPHSAYNGGRHMPPMDEYDDMPHMGGYPPEARRRRDKRGRYMTDGMDYDDDEEDYSPRSMYGSPQMRSGNSYGDIYARGTIYAPGAMNKPMGGMHDQHQSMSAPVDERQAMEWVHKMDGGEHFKPEQADQFRSAICPHCDKWEYFVAINAMYSDYCETAKKMGMDKPEFYAHLARDFLNDKDAGPHKLRKYMETIPK